MAEHPMITSRDLSPKELLILVLSAGEAGQRELAKMTWRAEEATTAGRRAGAYGRMCQLAKSEQWDTLLRILQGLDPMMPAPPVEIPDRE